jgi:prepilin-type processing-associated H-X9-DG protein
MGETIVGKRNELGGIDWAVMLGCGALVLMTLGAVGDTGRRRAKEVVCLANLSRWGGMLEGYTTEHDGHFYRGWEVGQTDLWMNALRPYYREEHRLLLCPAATGPLSLNQGSLAFAAWSRVIDVPGGGKQLHIGSYSDNTWTNNMTVNRGSRRAEWSWRTVRDVENPSQVPVFADSIWHDAWPRHTDVPRQLPVDKEPIGAAAYDEMNLFAIERHDGGINGLFMDWSARKVGLKELWTLKWHREFNTAGPWTKAGGVQPQDWPEWIRPFKDY